MGRIKVEVIFMRNFFFDFDSTLADTRQVAVVATQTAYQKRQLTVPAAEQIVHYMGVPIEVSFAKMADRHLSATELTALYQEFRQQYALADGAIKPFAGMAQTLAQLRRNGAQLFVVSSKHSVPLRRNLAQLQMDQTFQALCGSDMVAHYKPAPDGILALIERFKLDPTQSVMIGDAIYDIQMGQNAHVQTAGAMWGAADPAAVRAQQPTYLLQSPADLLQI